VIITPSLDTDWVRPLAGLRRRGVAVLACIIDPLAHDTQTRLMGRVPDLGADGREAWARDVRTIRHALAEQDVPTVLIDPVRPLGVQMVLAGGPAGERVA
jgi:hypothetical protein